MKNLKDLFQFLKFIDDFNKIERDIPQSSGFNKENDSEHSYQLAMVSWYLATTESNKLDTEKILKYSLVHDLPEIYAGDTPLYTSDNESLNNKKEREINAIEKIKKEFLHFPDLHKWIEKYEKQEDEESQLVYAVDKLLPVFSIFMDNGHAWKTHKLDLDVLIKKNKERVSASSIAKKYFDLIILAIQNDKKLLETNPTVFEKVVTHDRERCDVHHFDVDNFDEIPDELKLKAHAVCMHNGKMLIVNHPEWDIWSIPGGTRDDGESIEETLKREIQEETNCEVVHFTPISYQKIVSPDGKKCHYRLQYLCDVAPLGEFKSDVAGNINKISWIEPSKFDEYIENKEFKKIIIRRALGLLKNHENKED
jgi:putative hydrolase of HD superfamily